MDTSYKLAPAGMQIMDIANGNIKRPIRWRWYRKLFLQNLFINLFLSNTNVAL